MRIRFLQTVESAAPGFPFQPGQVIDVDSPTPQLLAHIERHVAEEVREEDALAVEESVARAVTRKRK